MGDTRTFYRYVSLEELEDWRESGLLRAGENSLEQKFLTDSKEDALEWWALFETYGWYGAGEGGAVLEIEVSAEVVEQFEYHGDNHDGIGPAWTAKPNMLDDADIRVTCEWEADENPT